MAGCGAWRKTLVVRGRKRRLTALILAHHDTGFAVFFAVFELTRRAAARTKLVSSQLVQQGKYGLDAKAHRHMPKIVHAMTLVTGGAIAGLAYEVCCRPWDVARKAVHVDRVVSTERHSIPLVLLNKARDDGWLSFVRNPVQHVHDHSTSPVQKKLQSLARTLARVGPWGIGFLVWEAFGPGIS